MDEQQLLQQIASLAGAINTYKNQQGLADPPESQDAKWKARKFPRAASRNQSLVVNPSTKANRPLDSSAPYSIPSTHHDLKNNDDSTSDTSQYVSKKDRHMQLIRKNIFELDLQARQASLEAQREKIQKERKSRIKNYLQNNLQSGTKQLLTIDERSYLADVSSTNVLEYVDENPSPPKHFYWNNKAYLQTKKNLFKEVGNSPSSVYCRYYNSSGYCANGSSCMFVHDPSRRMICPKFLNEKCTKGEKCSLSHDLDTKRIPACYYFLQGKCNNVNCRYVHVHYSETAPICFEFAKYSYCELGTSCKEKHVLQCSEFAMNGSCANPQCRLYHGALEKNGNRKSAEERKDTETLATNSTGVDSKSAGVSQSVDDNIDFISL
ncbi:MTREC (exosome adaptor) complex zf-CCCH type zinc finger subunit Red5 [Schizosaccharomyces osmophilus]|uniref:MTREC (Exosome adaptor) complex zf-CCCH type zinc finger subunit Red5 n=1 Tax=Schizosaccharomyces osmophilus TaxID=2545709 RepID=A0AAE9WDZ6_9SCHI|nr:MTREC (exosome adaptor) complex zf-CCCH type zinc finger subunit Red5 [Schizosaccharomyces osmophilus]WBW72968.1 MTREC (exosome adaptor) complex zf-CCCH type zinc finger subunit Red5 [Schizosaccharomyces osmophilus]